MVRRAFIGSSATLAAMGLFGAKGEAAVFSPSLVIPGAKIYKARWVK